MPSTLNGYAAVPGRRGERTIVEAEAEIVRRVFAEHVAGRTPRDIAIDLNRDQVQPPGRGLRDDSWQARPRDIPNSRHTSDIDAPSSRSKRLPKKPVWRHGICALVRSAARTCDDTVKPARPSLHREFCARDPLIALAAASASAICSGDRCGASERLRARPGSRSQRTSTAIPRLQMSAQFGLAEVPKKPAVAFHRNLMFEDLQRLP
jgi:hypothetical protein